MSCTIENQVITNPTTESGDGIGLDTENFTIIKDTVIDFSNKSIDNIDECLGITRGAQAYVEHSKFKGAQKLVLVGCGDAEWIPKEKDKVVIFNNCHFCKASRRMPEVQDGMKVLLINCTIEDWCEPTRYQCNPKKNRGFGAWSHNDGEIVAISCLFKQSSFWKGWKVMLCDLLGHLGNTFNEEGILGFFKPKNWIPGVCRGLTSSDTGKVKAYDCTKNHWWIRIENHKKVRSSKKLDMILQSWINSLSIDNKLLYSYCIKLKVF